MKQAQMPIIAFGLFFVTKFSTARYLLVEIDEGADGTRPNWPPGIFDPFRNIKLDILAIHIDSNCVLFVLSRV